MSVVTGSPDKDDGYEAICIPQDCSRQSSKKKICELLTWQKFADQAYKNGVPNGI